jgi:hypothetical protein
MERVVHKASSHPEATRWDTEQHVAMTPEERLRAARAPRDRAYPEDAKEVRGLTRPSGHARMGVSRDGRWSRTASVECPRERCCAHEIVYDLSGRPKSDRAASCSLG